MTGIQMTPYLIGGLFCLCVVSGVTAACQYCRGKRAHFWLLVFLGSALAIVGLAP